VGDSGYDGPRLGFGLADLPVRLVVRVRSDRVMCLPAPPREPCGAGRPARHGPEMRFADPQTWPEPTHTTSTHTTRYGTATARAFDRLHPRLTRRGGWADHDGDLPILEATVIRLQVDHLPGDARPTPLWLWCSAPAATLEEVDQLWQAYLRRFDLEHTFRFLKQTLGWTRARPRSPEAGDRWTQIILAAHTQLRLSRDLAHDLRRPWERPAEPDRLTPARVRRGFRHIHGKLPRLAGAPKPSHPGPGRPPGSPNAHRAPRHDPGKKIKTAAGKGKKEQTG
jgi:DDE superfamily endonuclease